MGIINQLRLASAFVFPRTGDSFKIIFVVIAVIAVLAVLICLLLPKLTKKSAKATAQVEESNPPTDEEAAGQPANGDADTDSSDDRSSDN